MRPAGRPPSTCTMHTRSFTYWRDPLWSRRTSCHMMGHLRLAPVPSTVLSVSTKGREPYTIRPPAPNVLADGFFGSDNTLDAGARLMALYVNCEVVCATPGLPWRFLLRGIVLSYSIS